MIPSNSVDHSRFHMARVRTLMALTSSAALSRHARPACPVHDSFTLTTSWHLRSRSSALLLLCPPARLRERHSVPERAPYRPSVACPPEKTTDVTPRRYLSVIETTVLHLAAALISQSQVPQAPPPPPSPPPPSPPPPRPPPPTPPPPLSPAPAGGYAPPPPSPPPSPPPEQPPSPHTSTSIKP